MNLLLLESVELGPDGLARVRGERARHVFEILKKGVGETLRIGMTDGPLGQGEILRVGKEELELRCQLEGEVPPRQTVDLVVALPRPQTLKKVLQSAAAMGVDRILLTRARKVEKSYFSSPLLLPEALRHELLLGLSQARDTRVPRVEIIDTFNGLLGALGGLEGEGALRLLAEPGAGRSLAGVPGVEGAGRVILAIGPEGGWVPWELEKLSAAHFMPFDLGPRILRVETAVVAMLAQLALLREASSQASSLALSSPARTPSSQTDSVGRSSNSNSVA